MKNHVVRANQEKTYVLSPIVAYTFMHCSEREHCWKQLSENIGVKLLIGLQITEVEENQAVKTEEVIFTKKPVYDFFKRLFDLVVAIICLTVGLPVYIVIAAVIMIDDFGNPFFFQDRVGKDGKVFKMIKFRTMFKDADKRKSELLEHNEYNDVHFKMENDPRITRVGKFLRKTSLDETPQAVNILTGSMSVIGPRPFVISEQDQLPADRLYVKPGLSCYWQITDTAKLSGEEQLELDYRYIRERSVLTDLKIILMTVGVMFRGRNS